MKVHGTFRLDSTSHNVGEHAEGAHEAWSAQSQICLHWGRIFGAPFGCKHAGEPRHASTLKESTDNDIELVYTITDVRLHSLVSLGRGILFGRRKSLHGNQSLSRVSGSPTGGVGRRGYTRRRPQLSSARIFDPSALGVLITLKYSFNARILSTLGSLMPNRQYQFIFYSDDVRNSDRNI